MSAHDPDALRRMALQPVSPATPAITAGATQALPAIIQTAEIKTLPQSLAAFLTTGNWLDRYLEPPEPLLGEVITNTTRMFVGGPTGLGKSHLGMAMAAGMATGQGFAHWKSPRLCKILYIDGEMARDLVQERLGDITRRIQPEHHTALKANLHVLCLEDCEEIARRYPKLGTMAPLNTEQGQEFFLRLVDMLGKIDAIFFDNRMSVLSGDMKEEQPWTDTMPLVKELTRRRIAQIWVDHTGHDTGKLYGTKTKEWQFDAVALLSKVDRPNADISFALEFTKARRRKPSNRADFEKMAFAMVDDEWTFAPATESTAGAGNKGLSVTEQGWLKDLNDMFAEPTSGAKQRPITEVASGVSGPSGASGASGASGPMVLALDRDSVRKWLRQRGKFTLTSDGNLTGADREKMRATLNALKDKHKIGLSKDYVWLL